ncbi:pyridoxal phosphate-dependent aminotransferase [Pedobacter gandavensis]|uniref:Aminotransferase class I/II-fold pyridoxal phosphate-dependent enzyme n=1 Tax=Pedobacter gandavensis TaxID=2679963 RepID=A0ABR6EYL6_9SPHI|nr:aminotransferase class I/II-fold pyridoxal phosphate-dependent enzyme [Pedobacter gandavensis]MBB2150266.1 aminotransferase class I/II-fold pyridoxal phosphate-dependent enzyme [Pedobacter gandavensis]
MKVSVLANTLIGSEIIKIGNEVNEMKRKGAEIANLTIGDFDPSIFPIPAELKEEIIDAYHHNQTNYPPADGILPLRETVVGVLKDRYALSYTTQDILVAGGSRPLIYATYLALIDPGDKVIYPAPSWNNNHYCHLSSAKGIAVETTVENNFMPTAAQLKPHLKGATLLALCSPLNPTGTMFTKAQLEEICDVVIAENDSRSPDEKPLYIMYDQIYSLLTFGKEHINPVSLRPELKDYVIYIDGISKCLSATGVRVGWGFGPEKIIGKMKSILGHIGAWAPKAEQVAVAKYFKNANLVDQYLSSFKKQVQNSLDALYNGFQQLKTEGFAVDAVIPMGAIYLTLKIDYIGKTTPEGEVLKNSADVNFYLIKEAQVALVPFSAFGTDETVNWFRASVGGCSLSDIENMIPRIKAALSKLK